MMRSPLLIPRGFAARQPRLGWRPGLFLANGAHIISIWSVVAIEPRFGERVQAVLRAECLREVRVCATGSGVVDLKPAARGGGD